MAVSRFFHALALTTHAFDSQINNTSLENLSLKKAKKLIDGCKDKLDLVVKRESKSIGESHRQEDSRHAAVYGNRRTAGDSITRQNWSNQNVYVQPPTRSTVSIPPPPPPPAQPVQVDVRAKAMFTDDPAMLKKAEADREGYYGTRGMGKHYAPISSAPSSASSTEIKKRKSHRNPGAGLTKSATIGHSSSRSDRIRGDHHHHSHSTRSSMAAPPLPAVHAEPAELASTTGQASEGQKKVLSAKEKEEADREDYYGTPAKDFAGLFERYPSAGVPVAPASPVMDKKRKSYASNRNSVVGSPSKSSTSAANNGNSNLIPPRVDRGRKPERFKSAHERLFGKGSDQSPPPALDSMPTQGSNRDSMASPEYMNSSSFSMPSSSTTTAANAAPYSSCVKSVTRTVSTVSSTGSSSTPYLRSKYQSFLSDLIRTKEPPPPPPPKPSNYQPVYLTKENLTPRLNPPPPVIVSSNAVFPPPPPVTPPASSPPSSSANLMPANFPPPPVSSSSWFADPELEAPYQTARPTIRPPPPSAQDLLLTTRR